MHITFLMHRSIIHSEKMFYYYNKRFAHPVSAKGKILSSFDCWSRVHAPKIIGEKTYYFYKSDTNRRVPRGTKCFTQQGPQPV